VSQTESVNDILDYAISREEEAAEFYLDLAERMERPWMRDTFVEFAQEEMGHKKRLQAVKQGRLLISAAHKIQDLKIGDYLVDVAPGDALDYKQALIVAMKREKASFKLYTDLAAAADSDEVREIFRSLAQEEARHKLRFELEYDREFLTEN